jgi:hypothetical protein
MQLTADLPTKKGHCNSSDPDVIGERCVSSSFRRSHFLDLAEQFLSIRGDVGMAVDVDGVTACQLEKLLLGVSGDTLITLGPAWSNHLLALDVLSSHDIAPLSCGLLDCMENENRDCNFQLSRKPLVPASLTYVG